ncbi:DsbA family protein [Terriglobus sp.]|uniref:DsbA family protein n=1 Tax=Terriglobus sp. TaxID=1889013 RepID=UPI003B000BC0
MGCRAQRPAVAGLTPDLARRIEVTIRTRASIPFNYQVQVTDLHPDAAMPNYNDVTVTVGEYGKPGKPLNLLLSKDGNTLAQMTTFDLTKDPRDTVSDAGRPARGGSEKAPVRIVVFDDLECPFCARMHEQMFPAILNRYGDQVRIVYKDFPLSQHPWAIHAAINADCLGDQNTAAYWSYVDHLHAQAASIGGEEHSLTAAKIQLDKIATDTGSADKLDASKLQACIAKQDETPVTAGLREGESLNINGVPALYINGETISGAAPIEFVYRAVDDALLAQGVTPPPAVPLPDLNAPAPATPPAAAAPDSAKPPAATK